jgi:hypothetical protein
MIKCNRCGADHTVKTICFIRVIETDQSSMTHEYCEECFDLLISILQMYNTDGPVCMTEGDMAMESGAEI